MWSPCCSVRAGLSLLTQNEENKFPSFEYIGIAKCGGEGLGLHETLE